MIKYIPFNKEFIEYDEYVEITPDEIRLRKKILDEINKLMDEKVMSRNEER